MMNVNTTIHPDPRRLMRCFSVEVTEDYRLLEPGELIEYTDEVFSGLRYGWSRLGLKAGQLQKLGYRPRRRKIVQPVRTYVPAESAEMEFPHYWLNLSTVYVATSADCQGYFWSRQQWVKCAEGKTMVEHAREFCHVYSSIVPLRAEKEFGVKLWALPEVRMNATELYHELLYAVTRKFPGETRHQTALRYIKQAEECPQWAKDAAEMRKKIFNERNENAS